MEKKGLSNFYSELPQWAKGIVGVTILAGVVVVGYGVYKKLNKSKEQKDSEEALQETNKDIKDLSKSQQPSYMQSQYMSFSDALYEAMSGLGTSTDSINSVFYKMKNTIDVLKLIQAFGVRDYTDDKFFIWNTKPMNLNKWISAELSDDEKGKLNKILSERKIKYQF